MRRIRLLAFGIALAQTGCSFLFVKGPPSNERNIAPDEMPVGRSCTRSYTAPVLDTIWAGLHGLSLVMLGAASESSTKNRDSLIGIEIAWLTLAVSSAVWGYTKVGECREVTGPEEDQRSWGIGQRPVESPTAAPPQRKSTLPPGFIPMGRTP
jgi:hypothetical protein